MRGLSIENGKLLRHCALDQKRHAVLDMASQKQETFTCTRPDCHATNVARSDTTLTVMLNLSWTVVESSSG